MHIVTVLQSVALPLFLKFGLAAVIALVVKDLPKWSEHLIGYVKEHSKAKAVQNLVAWIVHNAEGVVLKLEADTRPYVKQLEDDGSLSKEGRANLRAVALSDLKAQLGPAVLGLIHDVLGIQSTALDGFLTGIIEGAVGKLNVNQAAAAANLAQVDQVAAAGSAMSFLNKMGQETGLIPETKTELAVVKPLPTVAPAVAPATPAPAQTPAEPSPK